MSVYFVFNYTFKKYSQSPVPVAVLVAVVDLPFCEPGNVWPSKVFLITKCVHLYTTSCQEHNCFMHTHALRYEEFNGIVYNNVRLCSHDQNSKWPPFSPTIPKLEHNLIAFCYISMILFCPFLCFTISGLKRKYFNCCPPKKTE